ncbi:hypothetical protein [Halothiobacillus sp. 15-55-196]|nr:hypothetical protein [Halothiobacillus sp. 15-55-196]
MRQIGSRAREAAAAFDWARITRSFERHLNDVLQSEAGDAAQRRAHKHKLDALTNQDKTGV